VEEGSPSASRGERRAFYSAGYAATVKEAFAVKATSESGENTGRAR
jgi:hypothetical protein